MLEGPVYLHYHRKYHRDKPFAELESLFQQESFFERFNQRGQLSLDELRATRFILTRLAVVAMNRGNGHDEMQGRDITLRLNDKLLRVLSVLKVELSTQPSGLSVDDWKNINTSFEKSYRAIATQSLMLAKFQPGISLFWRRKLAKQALWAARESEKYIVAEQAQSQAQFERRALVKESTSLLSLNDQQLNAYLVSIKRNTTYALCIGEPYLCKGFQLIQSNTDAQVPDPQPMLFSMGTKGHRGVQHARSKVKQTTRSSTPQPASRELGLGKAPLSRSSVPGAPSSAALPTIKVEPQDFGYPPHLMGPLEELVGSHTFTDSGRATPILPGGRKTPEQLDAELEQYFGKQGHAPKRRKTNRK